jgi:hypothetical protein
MKRSLFYSLKLAMVSRACIRKFLKEHEIYDTTTYSFDDMLVISRCIRGDFSGIEENPNALCFAGFYCMYVTKNYEEMRKYAVIASNMGNGLASRLLGMELNWQFINDVRKTMDENEVRDAEKAYYLDAIKKGNDASLIALAKLHADDGGYEMAMKLLVEARDKGHVIANAYIGWVLGKKGNDNDKAEMYFDKAERDYRYDSSVYLPTVDLLRGYYDCANNDMEFALRDWNRMSKEGSKHACIAIASICSLVLGNIGYEFASVNLFRALIKNEFIKSLIHPNGTSIMKECLTEAVNIGFKPCIRLLAYVNVLSNKLDSAEKYAILANELDGKHCNFIGVICELQNKYTDAEHWYAKSLNEHVGSEYVCASYNYTMLLIKTNRQTEAVTYLQNAREYEFVCNHVSEFSYAIKEIVKLNKDIAKLYLQKHSHDIVCSIGNTIRDNGDIENALFCWHILADKDVDKSYCISTCLNLYKHYKDSGNKSLMVKYAIKATQYGDTSGIETLKRELKDLDLFLILQKCVTPSSIYNAEIARLRSVKSVAKYICRKNEWTECGVCLNCKTDKTCVPLACMCLLCDDCLFDCKSCPNPECNGCVIEK